MVSKVLDNLVAVMLIVTLLICSASSVISYVRVKETHNFMREIVEHVRDK